MQTKLYATTKNIIPARLRPWIKGLPASVERLKVRLGRTMSSPKPPNNPGGKVYINLGCGHIRHPSFINVDALVAPHIHHIRPIDDLSPFADDTADLIYASHCLEHFSHHRVDTVLGEWRRVLKPGGILRLGVPDFDKLLSVYEAAGRDLERIQWYLMGAQTYPLNAHYTMFTRRSLTDRLIAVGFSAVREWHHGTDELTSLNDCTGEMIEVGGRSFPMSLNLEAVK